ncbi:GGDEF domain-containing protein [Aliidiomarina sp. Khilg15.8]
MPLQPTPYPTTELRGVRRHQVSLIRTVLIIMLIAFPVITLLNLLVFEAYLIAAIDFAGFVAAGVAWSYFHRTRNIKVTAWFMIISLIAVLLSFIHVAEGGNYSLMWVTIMPPLVFFLLGSRVGAWVSAVLFAYIIGYLYIKLPTFEPTAFSLGALLNVIEVLVALWFIFRHYERSRASAFEELERLSNTDKLTGLYNRLRLDELLSEQLALSQRSGSPFSVVLCDIDHFKKINDDYGHLVGDEVLIELSTLLQQHTRATDYVGRWGGEEFLIICPATTVEGAQKLIESLRLAVADLRFSQDLTLTMSFGIAAAHSPGTIASILKTADTALYEAKRQGRNRVVVAAA